MVSLHGRAEPFVLFLVCSTAATLFLSPSSCHAAENKYGVDINDDIYFRLGVRPPHNHNRVLKLMGVKMPISRWSWKIHGRILPLLHFFDRGSGGSKNEGKGRPPDVFVNLRVLWCKLLSSLDPDSPAYEGKSRGMHNADDSNNNCEFATYRMLPTFSIKWPLRHLGLWRFCPRWMHANIELRTVYLQGALKKVFAVNSDIAANPSSGDREYSSNFSVNAVNSATENICVIVLGGGYDPRGGKLETTNGIRRVYELDLLEVIESKRRLLHRAGFRVMFDDDDDDDNGSSVREQADIGVRLRGVDLNDDAAVDKVLDTIQHELILFSERLGDNNASTGVNSKERNNKWRIVVISEAVLMYLQPGKASRVLEGLAERFNGFDKTDESHFAGASFVFADRLIRSKSRTTGSFTVGGRLVTESNVDSGEDAEVRQWLQEIGWKLQELLFKPGATRHLGIATTV
eukprot:jgi/Psemu1/11008/gm1.11008_g